MVRKQLLAQRGSNFSSRFQRRLGGPWGGLIEDEDVAREQARACGDVPGGSASIVVKQLMKRFVAVAHATILISMPHGALGMSLQ